MQGGPVNEVTEKRNTRRFILANGMQSVGDQVINAKTVLPWLLSSMGAASWLVALLVPIRESGSMLPQAALMGWLASKRRRSGVWIMGSLIQGVSVALMAVVAALGTGTWGGIGVVVTLAGMSLGRSLTSISSKDVMGRTITKGRRGRVNGLSTVVGGVVALTVGLAIRFAGSEELPGWVLVAMIGGGAVMWFLAAMVFSRVEEPDIEADGRSESWFRATLQLLRDDAKFRNFVIVRSLLLASALAPAFMVSLAVSRGSDALSGLGPYMIASGVAALVAGRISGWFADRSSRDAMSWSALAASILLLVVVAVAQWGSDDVVAWAMPVLFFLISVIHTQVRVARKTYVVDMAEGDQRTTYVAVANTAMGVLLLVTGAVSGVIATLGDVAALLFLAVIGIVGTVMARRLPDVSVGT